MPAPPRNSSAAGVTIERVVVVTARKDVGAVPTVEAIRSGIAGQRVVTGVTVEIVVVGTAGEHIGPGAAIQTVGSGVAAQGIIAVLAVETIGPRPGNKCNRHRRWP